MFYVIWYIRLKSDDLMNKQRDTLRIVLDEFLLAALQHGSRLRLKTTSWVLGPSSVCCLVLLS